RDGEMIQWTCADGCGRTLGELIQRWPDLVREQTQDPDDERYSRCDLKDVQNGLTTIATARALTQEIDEECESIPMIDEETDEEIDPETEIVLTNRTIETTEETESDSGSL